jgi:hypothetical protein
MNVDYERKLEIAIDAELKALPELEAPVSLVSNVMKRTVLCAAVPWHRRSWEMWPAGLRFAALALLLGGFGGLCFASWQLTRVAGFANAMQEVGQLFWWVSTVWNVLSAVVNGFLVVLKHIHPAILVGCAAVFALTWSACVGLGTAFVRLAFVRR